MQVSIRHIYVWEFGAHFQKMVSIRRDGTDLRLAEGFLCFRPLRGATGCLRSVRGLDVGSIQVLARNPGETSDEKAGN